MTGRKVSRSSVDGRFVTGGYAKNHPRTTETQRIDGPRGVNTAYRNSENGQFVTRGYAQKHPRTTEQEHL